MSRLCCVRGCGAPGAGPWLLTGARARPRRYRGPVLIAWTALVLILAVRVAAAQDEHQHGTSTSSPQQQPDEHAQHPPAHQHDVQGTDVGGLFASRDASGTAWLPDLTPMHGIHRQAGAWSVMLHGNAFAQFLYEHAPEHRGARQAGSINWAMAMARRNVGDGRIGLRTMVSLEPWTIPGCGYPDLLATGETCRRDTIHDRQHPHDLFMELAAEYARPLTSTLRWEIYAGLSGEPALGPVAYPHRASALPNPLAPITHHWLDASHITFGVVTAAVSGARWKADASAFNGREPDENRWDLDLGALQSFSGRLSFAPSARLALQVSAGRLNDAEDHASLPRTDVTRVTASAIYHRPLGNQGLWATTVAWGANVESDALGTPGTTTGALLLEATASATGTNTWFGRVEIVGKPAHDLHVHEASGVFTVGKLQLGYSRAVRSGRGLEAGIGGSVSASLVPPAMANRYGGRIAPGFGVFLTLRPASHATASPVSAAP